MAACRPGNKPVLLFGRIKGRCPFQFWNPRNLFFYPTPLDVDRVMSPNLVESIRGGSYSIDDFLFTWTPGTGISGTYKRMKRRRGRRKRRQRRRKKRKRRIRYKSRWRERRHKRRERGKRIPTSKGRKWGEM
ncbi:unnamed protein product [Nesidiocoris tenuis]|uniref:Uncharacterized protein n=1 Tax=Nesidiocoris tenuis TaxID=355587 RepID=A0A6H5FWR0_9HEMI|nr:unnamed protein product [Nesidiocoris tenuis]